MEIQSILGVAIVVALFFFVSLLFVGENGRQKHEEQKSEVVEDTGPDVLGIVRNANKSLTRQKAAGYGPWLSAVISHGGAPINVALTAIQWTISELWGSRFNLDGLYAAKTELEEMMGEWG